MNKSEHFRRANMMTCSLHMIPLDLKTYESVTKNLDSSYVIDPTESHVLNVAKYCILLLFVSFDQLALARITQKFKNCRG